MQTPVQSLLEQRREFLSFVQRRVLDKAIAEDILQSAYMRALEHEGELRANESAVAWFYRILRNAVIDYYRRRSTEGAALERWARELEQEPEFNEPLHETVCCCIDKVLDQMTPSYAEALREVDLDEKPVTEFAKDHGITPTNAGVRVHRARAALRRHLIETCGSCAEHGCIDCFCRSASNTEQAAI